MIVRARAFHGPEANSPAHPLLIAGDWVETRTTAAVVDPDDAQLITGVALADVNDIEDAIASAQQALGSIRWSVEERANTLSSASTMLADRADEFATIVSREGVKTIREARSEVARAINTLRLSAAAALIGDPASPAVDDRPGTRNWRASVRRTPVGLVVAITPFNDPLNLVAHKVGPALAAGNAVIVRPDVRTPLSALALSELLVEAGVPQGFLSAMPSNPDEAKYLVEHRAVRFVSFTGGRRVGALVHAAANGKGTLLELGGICPTIVMDDADLNVVVPALIEGAVAAAGQNCLHVQRIIAQRPIYADLRKMLIDGLSTVPLAPKWEERSGMGPMIDAAAMTRMRMIVSDAVTNGARLLVGGEQDGPRFQPTLFEDVPPISALARDESFGPISELCVFDDFSEAVELANRGDGGIQAGLFTNRADVISAASSMLDFGAVVIGGTSDNRSDALPFGGTGLAGLGREGVLYAAEAMSELKVLLNVSANGGSTLPT